MTYKIKHKLGTFEELKNLKGDDFDGEVKPQKVISYVNYEN